jgi:hypothetical protein
MRIIFDEILINYMQGRCAHMTPKWNNVKSQFTASPRDDHAVVGII